MQTRVYIFAEKILTLQKITPAILPFKNLTWESKNGERGVRGCLQIRVQSVDYSGVVLVRHYNTIALLTL